MGGLSPWHLLIVLVVVLLLFGSKKLPDTARGLGRSLRIFKSEMKEMRNDDDDEPTDGQSRELTQGQPNAAQYAQPQPHPQQAAQPQQQAAQPQQQPQQYTDPSAPPAGNQGNAGQ